MNSAELNECINSIAHGNRTALKDLYDQYKKQIFLYAFSITKNHHLSEDIMQDTFINIIKYAQKYVSRSDTITNPKAWLFSIAKNQSIKAMKKSHQRELEDIDDFEEVLITYDSLEQITETVDSVEALKNLEPIELQIVSLYVYGELKQTEIAEVLKLPYSQIRSKYAYAIKKLKKYYNEQGVK